jgi:NADH-quinone oxidoreductase subunit K
MSIELILVSVINFVVINKYLYPDMFAGCSLSIFIVAVAAETIIVSIIINLYRQIASVKEVKDTEIMKY